MIDPAKSAPIEVIAVERWQAQVKPIQFSAKVLDTGVGTALGWSSEREVGAGDVYNG